LRAAESLLELGGPDAVTTRAVCDAANVEAPTLYHRYGDKNGLFDALVAKGVKTFLKRKQAGPDTADALADLIPGWESFVGFALERPRLFRLKVQRVGDNPQILDAAMARTDARLIRLGMRDASPRTWSSPANLYWRCRTASRRSEGKVPRRRR
jgi:AcrR family transcriptional regulator